MPAFSSMTLASQANYKRGLAWNSGGSLKPRTRGSMSLGLNRHESLPALMPSVALIPSRVSGQSEITPSRSSASLAVPAGAGGATVLPELVPRVARAQMLLQQHDGPPFPNAPTLGPAPYFNAPSLGRAAQGSAGHPVRPNPHSYGVRDKGAAVVGSTAVPSKMQPASEATRADSETREAHGDFHGGSMWSKRQTTSHRRKPSSNRRREPTIPFPAPSPPTPPAPGWARNGGIAVDDPFTAYVLHKNRKPIHPPRLAPLQSHSIRPSLFK